jgi:hypothetical protein
MRLEWTTRRRLWVIESALCIFRTRCAIINLDGKGIGIFLDYLISLPEFWKVAFMIQRAGESQEGYRVSAPAPIHLVVLLMWYG